jgi:hypothetical protein
MRTWPGTALLAALVLAGCRSPTEITLILSSDTCATIQGTSITAGDPSLIATEAPTTETSRCDIDGGTIGTFVLAPSGSKDARVAVTIVSGIGHPADDCTPPAYENCIVARRELSFVPHTPLFLPILMSKACVNVPCSGSTTCVDHTCVSDEVPDPARCTDPAMCAVTVPGDGAVPLPDSGADALFDAEDAEAGSCGAGTPADSGPLCGSVRCERSIECCGVSADGGASEFTCSNDCEAMFPGTISEIDCTRSSECAPGLVCCVTASVVTNGLWMTCSPPPCTPPAGALACEMPCDCDGGGGCTMVDCPACSYPGACADSSTITLSTCGGQCPML